MSDIFELIGTEANLVTGPIRALLAPFSAEIPTPDGVFDQVSPYAVVDPFFDLGLTDGGSSQEREISTTGFNVEQRTAQVLERIDEVNRTFTIPVAEITPEVLQIIEEGGDPDLVEAGEEVGEYTSVGIGSIGSLTPYRLAFVAERDIALGGIVTEPSGEERGPFIVGIYNLARLSANSATIEWSKENLASCEIEFSLSPDPAVTEPKERVGKVYFEEAPQTIGEGS